MNIEELFILNPIVVNAKNIYIYWEDFVSCQMFAYLIERNVSIDGFINDELSGECLYNQPIVATADVLGQDGCCIIAIKEKIQVDHMSVCRNPIIPNPIIGKQGVMIYGCGYIGREVFQYLCKFKINVAGYIDSDKKKWGKRICNIEIHSPEILGKMDDSVVIVLAGKMYEKMAETVKHYSPKRKYLFHDYHIGEKAYLEFDAGCGIELKAQLNIMCNTIRYKNIYIYGQDIRTKKYIQVLKNLKLSIKGILTDTPGDPVDDCIENKMVEDILYEEDYFIIVCCKEQERSVNKLKNLGLEFIKDYAMAEEFRLDRYLERHMVVDINLAYTYISKSDDYGLSLLKAKIKEKYKIVTLGGSTTDGELYNFKSWPECLWDKLDKDYVSIYNYGVAGYDSGYELIKMMRDVIGQKPDLILIYTGANDFLTELVKNNAFAFSYLGEVMEFAARHLKDKVVNEKRLYRGEEIFPNNFSRWLSNTKIMNIIANNFGIGCYIFLQPMLIDKPNKSKKEAVMSKLHSQSNVQRKSFRKQFASLNKEEYGYIFDMTDTFDYVQDVYLDAFHVNEKGNAMIADRIYAYIEQNISYSRE